MFNYNNKKINNNDNKNNNNNNNNNNVNTMRFSNIKNFLSLKNFTILFFTLFISFFSRLLIIKLFHLDITLFSDFIILGFLVSFIRPIVTDLFNIIQYEILVLQELNSLNGDFNVNTLYKKGLNKDVYNTSQNCSSRQNVDITSNFKHLVKHRIFWYIWKMHSDKYSSFHEYLKSEDSSVKITSQMKKDLEYEYPELYRRGRKAKWFVKHVTRKR